MRKPGANETFYGPKGMITKYTTYLVIVKPSALPSAKPGGHGSLIRTQTR
jgi:hypothetical protein